MVYFLYLPVPVNTKHLYNNCTMQSSPNVFDVGPTLYKCYTNIICLLGPVPSGKVLKLAGFAQHVSMIQPLTLEFFYTRQQGR